MPKDKTDTHERILPAAMKEFLEKGYEKATMREIAAAAGLSAAGLYRHFADKEEMFAALVDPVLEECRKWYKAHRDSDYTYLAQGDLDAMWNSGSDMRMILTLVYGHFDVFKLLLCCSEGTRYAGFLHEFIMLEQKETLDYMEAAREKGVAVQQIEPRELHLLMTAYTNALFEVVIHDFTKEEAAGYIETLQKFFTPGWRAVLGL